jgi:hypothetical protein
MATPTTSTKPKRKAVARAPKPREIALVYKGQIDGAVEIVEDFGPEFVDRMMADRDLKYTRITIQPKVRKPRATNDAPLAASA